MTGESQLSDGTMNRACRLAVDEEVAEISL